MRVAATALLTVLPLVILFGNVSQVWGLTIKPNPPIAGQSFTITSSNPSSSDIITVFTGSGCTGSIVGGGGVGPLGSISLTLSAGQYSAGGITTANGCVDFTVISARGPTPFLCVQCRERQGKSFYHEGKLITDDKG